MTQWLLRVEGVNFASTLYDTNDLSTVRGASIALLHAEQVAQDIAHAVGSSVQPVFAGASQAAVIFTAPAAPADVAAAVAEAAEARLSRPGKDHEPFPHLDLMVEVVPLGSGDGAEEAALERATARTRLRQFQRFTTPPEPFQADARHADELDGYRPATHNLKMRRQLLDSTEERARAKPLRVSESVRMRKSFGARARQDFYRMEIALGPALADEVLGTRGKGLTFTDDIQAMVEPAQKEDSPFSVIDLPLSVRNKIAVVYADGNGFGDARIAARSTRAFSEALRPLQRQLLARLLRRLAEGARTDLKDAFALREGPRLGLRFETLLWGGDEMCFVMPAWLATGFVGAFLSAPPWNVESVPLTHALGVAIADRKTPIRQLQHIAKDAADAAKEAGRRNGNSVTFDIFESLAPPDNDLGKARASVYGAAAHAQDFARRLAFDGEHYLPLISRLRKITGEAGFPRSQIYAALRAARLAEAADLLGPRAQAASNASLEAYARRAGRDRALGVCDLILPGGAPPGATGETPLPSLLDLARTAMLWDYVSPQTGVLDILLPEAS